MATYTKTILGHKVEIIGEKVDFKVYIDDVYRLDTNHIDEGWSEAKDWIEDNFFGGVF